MTDRELLETILKKVEKIDVIENSLNDVHLKLDGMTQQIVQNSEELATVKEQTAANTEMKASLTNVIARIDEIETDLKIMKKIISS